MKILTLLALSLTVALGMSQENEDAPGPMVEDGPPAQVPVEDVAPVLPVPEDPEESQARRGSHCLGFTHNNRCYRFFKGPRRGDDAEVFCRRLSPEGHLASITSQHLHQEVLHLVQRSNGALTRFWVGGSRYLKSSRFIWLDGSPWVYSAWQPGRPRPTSAVENCVEVLVNGRFNDKRCSEAQAFVCSHPE
ncbi:unnamed protein product [Tetraodon nigroviridis]|uniref:(spotted green pufferfish) hypothetical protein n=1 Tax=Tetraodon nigroviridis TaxID=99883 RepID=Q4S0M2_TETNG|nr:unnamed protein product [Tetraodon nigroviridis]